MNLSQIVISSKIKHAPNVFVFTDYGILMLSSVLNSRRAVAVIDLSFSNDKSPTLGTDDHWRFVISIGQKKVNNIQIMRTFVKWRRILESNKDLWRKIEDLEKRYDGQFKVIFEALRRLMEPPPEKKKRPIGFVVDRE